MGQLAFEAREVDALGAHEDGGLGLLGAGGPGGGLARGGDRLGEELLAGLDELGEVPLDPGQVGADPGEGARAHILGLELGRQLLGTLQEVAEIRGGQVGRGHFGLLW